MINKTNTCRLRSFCFHCPLDGTGDKITWYIFLSNHGTLSFSRLLLGYCSRMLNYNILDLNMVITNKSTGDFIKKYYVTFCGLSQNKT